MSTRTLSFLCLMILVTGVPACPSFAGESEDRKKEEGEIKEELKLQEEGEFPDLVGADETGGVMDEFALLEEEMSAEEVVSASKHRQSIFWSPSAVTVFTREDIRDSGAQTFQDLMRRVPGFDVYELNPSFPVVGARALTEAAGNLVLVLVDGREALIEITGYPLWAGFTVDLYEVERIEVIRGPGSALYGANAFSGVVSITTVSDRPTEGDVLISVGEQGQRRISGRFRGNWPVGAGHLDLSASIGTLGRISPSDRRNEVMDVLLRGHGYVRYRLGRRLELSLHGGVTLGKGTVFMMLGDFRGTRELHHNAMLKVEFRPSDRILLKGQIYHTRYETSLYYRSNVSALGVWLANADPLYIDPNSLDAQVQADFQITDDLLVIAGGNLRYNRTLSETFYPPDLSEVRAAGFVNAKLGLWEILQLTGGVRVDWSSWADPAVSPRGVAVLRPWENHAFRLGYGLAFRKPSVLEGRMHVEVTDYNLAFPEIVEKLKSSFGNEELNMELVHSFEAGWRGHFLKDRLRASVDLFYNRYLDMIYFVNQMAFDSLGMPNISDSKFQFENQDGVVTALGGEMALSWQPDARWLLWGNLGLRHVTNDDGSRMTSEPVLRANLGGQWNPEGPGLLLDFSLHYVSSYTMPLIPYEDSLGEMIDVTLGNALLLVGRAGYRLKLSGEQQLEMGLTIRAPLGAPFREYPGVQIQRTRFSGSASDFAGERLVRLASCYLRWTM